jgi:YVTN family beta-propeller protein
LEGVKKEKSNMKTEILMKNNDKKHRLPVSTKSERNLKRCWLGQATWRRGLPLLTLALTWLASNAASGAQLFVTASNSSSVTVINCDNNSITKSIPVGQGPIRLAMTPDGLKAYISNSKDGTVSVIDTVNLTPSPSPIPTFYNGTQELTVTPDGGRVFVVHNGAGQVTVINAVTDTFIRNVSIPGTGAKDVLVTPDGRFAYVANYTANEVSVINTSTYRVRHIATPAGPRRLAITPGGDRIFVSDYLGNAVSVIDTLTQAVIENITVGNNPRTVAITPDGWRNLCDERERRHCLSH